MGWYPRIIFGKNCKMKNKNNKPPKIAEWLLKRFFPDNGSFSTIGDLEEVYQYLVQEESSFKAKTWYWSQLIKAIPYFFKDSNYWRIIMFRNYFKIAIRNIQKHKIYSFINISGLAVGMACALLVLVWVQNEFSFDKFHKNKDRLFRVAFSTDKRILFANSFHGELLPGLAADYLKENYPEIEAATIVGQTGNKLTVGENSFNSSGKFVHPSFLNMFTFPFVKGDPNTAFSSPVSIVITQELADKLFGNNEALGGTIKINDRLDIKVTGVVEKIPLNSHIQFDFLLPFQIAPDYMKKWDNKAPLVYVLLNEKSNWQEVSKKIVNVYNDHNPGSYPNYLYLQPFTQIHLHSLGGGGRITYIYIFSALAFAILLIACINFMNLTTACSSVRLKEIGIKKVVGSTRKQLIKQFLSESIIISFFALLIAIVLASIILPTISAILGEQLHLKFSGNLILGFIGIILFTGIVSGSYPAFFLSSFQPITIIRGAFFSETNERPSVLRKILVVAQFSCSIIFLISIIVIYNQLHFFSNKDLGFDRENIVTMNLNGDAWRNRVAIKNELITNSNIISASFTQGGLTGWNSSAGIGWEGKREDQIFDVGRNLVDYDYLETFKMKMAEGRFFSKEFPSDQGDACVLNESAIQAMEIKNPIGKTVAWIPDSPYERKATIVGVIKNYNTESLRGPIRPFILFCSDRGALLNVRIKPENMRNTITEMKEAIQKIVPNYTFSYNYLESELNGLYREEKITGGFIVYITLIAIIIASLGLFGLVSFSAERRVKEIGIRKVMGASSQNILTLLSKEFILLIIFANLIAWPISYYIMNKWLQNFAFHINLNPFMFLLSGFIVLFIALITVSFQSLKAAQTNPVNSLKYE